MKDVKLLIAMALCIAILLPWLIIGLSELPVSLPLRSLNVPFPPDHSRYRVLSIDDLAKGKSLATTDPMVLAKNLMGQGLEGQVIKSNRKSQVIGLTFPKHPPSDDSVRSVRYRLEFEPVGDQWQLIWVGQQGACWRGHHWRVWHPKLCP